jgi:hypothetical protein
MGKSFSEIPVAELANSKLRDTYDVVFINCADFTKVITPEMLANLRIFVEKGGILYGSDNAGEILAGAFPEQMQLYQDIYQGEKQSLTARVADAGLAKDLGTSELKINFPEGWVPVRLTGTGVSTLVLGDAKLFKTDTPVKDVIMSVSFKKGTGKVVFTGFHFSDLETPALRQNYINSVLF